MTVRVRKTKVIATLGPACDDVGILAQMIHAGMNVARLNFSHGTPDEHAARLDRLARACERAGRTVATMLDTRGGGGGDFEGGGPSRGGVGGGPETGGAGPSGDLDDEIPF